MISLIKKVPGWVAQILIYVILFLFMLYILSSFYIAIGNIIAISGLYNFTHNGAQSTDILKYLSENKVDIINVAGIVVMLFLWLLLLGIFKAEKGIVILPFIVDPGDKNSNGNAISEMLIAELKRIIRIHSVNIDSNRSSSEEMEHSASAKNLSATYPIKDIKEKAHLLPLSPKGENLDQSIQTIGTLVFGSTSIPIGSILIVLRNICPGADPGLIISGCLQKSESDICLISYMKRENRSWQIYKKIKNTQNISNKEFSALISELSYKIYYELLQLQSKQNISDAVVESSGKAPNDNLPSWEVLKYFTEALDALQTYNITKERKDLERARISGLKAASVDPYYNNPLYLLYNVGIAYLNNLAIKDYYEAERLARYIVGLRPDSSRAWYSWGLTLTFLNLNRDAIECYDNALFFDKYEIDEKDKIAHDIFFMRAISLRDLKHYDEAINHFNNFLDREPKNGYVWGHYGITLEAKAKSLDKASPSEAECLKDEAEKAFRKAIDFQDDFVSVHAALARIYQELYELGWENIHDHTPGNHSEDGKKLIKFIQKNFHFNWLSENEIEIKHDNSDKSIKITSRSGRDSLSLELLNGDKTYVRLKDPIGYVKGRYAVKKENGELKVHLKDHSQECNEAKRHKQTRKQTEYNRACYEINCGNKETALKLLESEISQNQISRQWLEDDPDWDRVRDEQKFKDLLINAKGKFDSNNLITRIAVRRKLDKESGNNSLFFFEYDIANPRELAEKIHKNCNIMHPAITYCKEMENLISCCHNIITEKNKNDLSSDELIVPYSMRRIFIEEKAKRSKELEKSLCNLLNLWLKDPYVFTWKKEKLTEDEEMCLKEYLVKGYNIDWVNTEKIEIKDPKIIEIINEEKTLSLELDGNESEVLLKINNIETEKLIAKKEYGLINIYKDPNNVAANRKFLEAAYPELKAENYLELSEDDKKSFENESFLIRARFHAASGNDDDALDLLYWALKDKQINAEDARFEPDFEFIRDKPRFKEMMERFSESERVNS